MVTFISLLVSLSVVVGLQSWEEGWTKGVANRIGATLFLFSFSQACNFLTCLLLAEALPRVGLVAAGVAVLVLVSLPFKLAKGN